MKKLENKTPDLIQKFGSKFWFSEMYYWSSSTGYRAILVNDQGLLCINRNAKTGLFSKEIQAAYREWAKKESEGILLDGQQEEEKT